MLLRDSQVYSAVVGISGQHQWGYPLNYCPNCDHTELSFTEELLVIFLSLYPSWRKMCSRHNKLAGPGNSNKSLN